VNVLSLVVSITGTIHRSQTVTQSMLWKGMYILSKMEWPSGSSFCIKWYGILWVFVLIAVLVLCILSGDLVTSGLHKPCWPLVSALKATWPVLIFQCTDLPIKKCTFRCLCHSRRHCFPGILLEMSHCSECLQGFQNEALQSIFSSGNMRNLRTWYWRLYCYEKSNCLARDFFSLIQCYECFKVWSSCLLWRKKLIRDYFLVSGTSVFTVVLSSVLETQLFHCGWWNFVSGSFWSLFLLYRYSPARFAGMAEQMPSFVLRQRESVLIKHS